MIKNSRFGYAIKNAGIGSIMQLLTIIFSFISRTIFVRILGNDYLSYDGLFSNILTLLSFSELGIGSAIIFSLYKPIEEDDKLMIGGIMNLFAKAYIYISIIIAIVGVISIPLINQMIYSNNVAPIEDNLIILYLLFLGNTIFSYIYGYSGTFLLACQKNYIPILVNQIINIIRIIIQTIILLLYHNYIGYLLVTIVCTISKNLITTYITYKKYPWLKAAQKEKIVLSEKRKIFTNIKSIFRYKLGSVVLNGIDNIIITKFLKVTYIGLSSNYLLVINAINSVINMVSSGITASIGSYNVSADKNDKYYMFKILYFISYWIFGYFSVMLYILLTPLIELWLGNSYLLNKSVVISLVFTFYISSINIIPSSYRTTMGFFKEAQNCPIYASILNIFLSVILSIYLGLFGVYIATAISKVLTYNLIDPYFIYKKGFNKNPIKFYNKFFGYTIILIINAIISEKIIMYIGFNSNWLGLILKLLFGTLVSNVLFFMCWGRTKTFKITYDLLKKKIIN